MNVLVVEDNEEQCEQYKRQIHSHFKRFDVACMCATTLQAGFERCDEMDFNLVLLDASLENSAPHDTVKRENIMRFGAPVIVMSGVDDTTLMDDALANGACDFIIKGVTSYVAQMEKIAIILKRFCPQIEVGPLITKSRSKPQKMKRWIADNIVALAAVLISFSVVATNFTGSVVGSTKGRWMSDWNLDATLKEHDRRITTNTTAIGTLESEIRERDKKADERQKEILEKISQLVASDAASKQQREDIEKSVRELRDDLRVSRR